MNPFEMRAKAYVEGRELTSEEWEQFHRAMRIRNAFMNRIFQLRSRRQQVTQEMLNRVIDL